MNIKKFIISAVVGAICWTVLLTPYMFLVVRNTLEQYISWLGMQFILVPLVAPIVYWLTQKIEDRVAKNEEVHA